MIDINLTNSGDIELESGLGLSKCKISFYVTGHSVQRINFITQQDSKKIKHQQNISFNFNNEDNLKLQSIIMDDVEEKIQAIRLRLLTEIKDTEEETVDTDFFTTRHTIIKSKENLKEIQRITDSIVNDIFPEARCEIVFENLDFYHYFFCCAVKIKLYYRDKLISSFIF